MPLRRLVINNSWVALSMFEKYVPPNRGHTGHGTHKVLSRIEKRNLGFLALPCVVVAAEVVSVCVVELSLLEATEPAWEEEARLVVSSMSPMFVYIR